MMVLIAFTQFTGFARVVRGETLSLRNKDNIESARSVGASNPRIIQRHILPNLANTISILAVLQLPGAILI